MSRRHVHPVHGAWADGALAVEVVILHKALELRVADTTTSSHLPCLQHFPAFYAMMKRMYTQAQGQEGGDRMDFVAVVDQVIALLRQRGRLTYRTLQRQFQLDDAALDDLKDELLYGQRLAADEDGRVLVWTGERGTATPAETPTRAPFTYIPAPISPRRSSPPKGRSKASASRSRSCLRTSRALWSCWPTATLRRPGSSSTRCLNASWPPSTATRAR